MGGNLCALDFFGVCTFVDARKPACYKAPQPRIHRHSGGCRLCRSRAAYRQATRGERTGVIYIRSVYGETPSIFEGTLLMNKTDLINAIAEQADLSKADATRAVDAFFEVVGTALKKKDKVCSAKKIKGD